MANCIETVAVTACAISKSSESVTEIMEPFLPFVIEISACLFTLAQSVFGEFVVYLFFFP